jgi:hypothetical protein
MSKNACTIDIPLGLYKRIEERAKKAGFKSAREYILFVLEEVVSELEEEEPALSKEDEEKVKERLRALGYL